MAISKIGSNAFESGAVDFTKIQQDIAVVAFESARADNRAAFSLPNAFIDQFEDDSGIDTTSSTGHDASEFVSSVVDTVAEYNPFVDETWTGSVNLASATDLGYTVNGGNKRFESTASGSGYAYTTTTETADARYEFEFQCETKAGGGGPFWSFAVNKNGGTDSIAYYGTTTTAIGERCSFGGSNDVGDRFKMIWDGRTSPNVITSFNDLDEDGTYENESTVLPGPGSYKGSAWDSTTPTTVGWFCTAYKDANPNWQIALKAGTKTTTATNATGNFTGVTQTASASVSKMSIVVMYEDNAGTATLNTDLVAQVSANNGTDFTTVTLAAAPALSNSIKVAKSAEVAVTAGTQPKYKISFANQSGGSKVTRVLGVALLY